MAPLNLIHLCSVNKSLLATWLLQPHQADEPADADPVSPYSRRIRAGAANGLQCVCFTLYT